MVTSVSFSQNAIVGGILYEVIFLREQFSQVASGQLVIALLNSKESDNFCLKYNIFRLNYQGSGEV